METGKQSTRHPPSSKSKGDTLLQTLSTIVTTEEIDGVLVS